MLPRREDLKYKIRTGAQTFSIKNLMDLLHLLDQYRYDIFELGETLLTAIDVIRINNGYLKEDPTKKEVSFLIENVCCDRVDAEAYHSMKNGLHPVITKMLDELTRCEKKLYTLLSVFVLYVDRRNNISKLTQELYNTPYNNNCGTEFIQKCHNKFNAKVLCKTTKQAVAELRTIKKVLLKSKNSNLFSKYKQAEKMEKEIGQLRQNLRKYYKYLRRLNEISLAVLNLTSQFLLNNRLLDKTLYRAYHSSQRVLAQMDSSLSYLPNKNIKQGDTKAIEHSFQEIEGLHACTKENNVQINNLLTERKESTKRNTETIATVNVLLINDEPVENVIQFLKREFIKFQLSVDTEKKKIKEICIKIINNTIDHTRNLENIMDGAAVQTDPKNDRRLLGAINEQIRDTCHMVNRTIGTVSTLISGREAIVQAMEKAMLQLKDICPKNANYEVQMQEINKSILKLRKIDQEIEKKVEQFKHLQTVLNQKLEDANTVVREKCNARPAAVNGKKVKKVKLLASHRPQIHS